MLRPAARISTVRNIARYTAYGVGFAGAGTAVGGAIYLNSPRGVGLKRELHFWNVLSPVIIDYWWNSANSSPKIKYQKWTKNGSTKPVIDESTGQDEISNSDKEKQERKELLQELHKRNASRVFDIMLQLGGLYVKLGQVLSVTALPIPNQYRDLFRLLQSNVPGHEEFESVIKPTLEKEFGMPLDEIFDTFEEIPCGAASIGQAHKAQLKNSGEEVVVKVQYPDANWQVPADIHCVGDFMKLCVWFGLIDESAARLSYDEFARQFIAELDYENERRNLEQVYDSSLNPNAPYIQRGVIIPKVFPEFCTKQVITMKFLPGPKFEEEAKRRLSQLGFDTTNNDLRSVVKKSAQHDPSHQQGPDSSDEFKVDLPSPGNGNGNSWKSTLPRVVAQIVGVDSIFFVARVSERIVVWTRNALASTVHAMSYLSITPESWEAWAEAQRNSTQLNLRINWTEEAIHALLDVHGYQILDQGLFNADPHPGNILIIPPGDEKSRDEPKIGLIDYGQCKRLSRPEQVRIARLILSVADDDSDEIIAKNFRSLGIQTKNDSTRFLANFARLMFGSFKPEYLDHSWHRELHKEDKVVYFPNELSMVYRTSLLLRGLAMSLQQNISVSKLWRHHAQNAVQKYELE